MMTTRDWRAGVGAIVAWMVACTSPVDPSVCPSLEEFGSNGCAQVIVKVAEPPDEVSGPYFLAVSAILDGGEILSHAPAPRFGSFLMLIQLNPFASIREGDTASVWLRANVVSTVPSMFENPILASDSALTTLVFAGAGHLPALDTVDLRPR